MTGALLSFSAMAISVRALARTLGVMEILALRAGIGLMVLATIAALRPDLRRAIPTRHLPLHLFRNAVHVCSSYLWGVSLLLIPLATAFALEFTTRPGRCCWRHRSWASGSPRAASRRWCSACSACW